MFIIEISNPITLLLIVIATSLLIFLAQEIKDSRIAAIPLIVFLIILTIYIVQFFIMPDEYKYLLPKIYKSIAIVLIFVFITFFSYLWVDDLETKKKNKHSLDNSLDWLWKDV